MYAGGMYAGGSTEPSVTAAAHMSAAEAARVTAETTVATAAMLRPQGNCQQQPEHRNGSQLTHTK